MALEFRCAGCSKLLRTPDESAGKKAKCPQCGEIVDVPQATPVPTSQSNRERAAGIRAGRRVDRTQSVWRSSGQHQPRR